MLIVNNVFGGLSFSLYVYDMRIETSLGRSNVRNGLKIQLVLYEHLFNIFRAPLLGRCEHSFMFLDIFHAWRIPEYV